MKRYFSTILVLSFLLIFFSSFTAFIFSSQPPQGSTGAANVYCTQCHSGSLNSAGGNVEVTGLPDAGYTAGVTYTFSLINTHSVANRRRWGFSIEARNASNQVVGVFSTTNANAAINGNELSHLSAISTGLQASFTYNNLKWTAPANPGVADQSITFYFVGLAADGGGSSGGDFTYSSTKSITLLQATTYTFTGNGNWDNPANWSNNILPPAILTGKDVIIIDPPAGSECILNVIQRVESGATFTVRAAKQFKIIGDLIIN